jgi:hypothetical protein
MTKNTKTLATALIVGLAAALLPSAMWGQEQVCPGLPGATSCYIDDFSSGFYSKSLSQGGPVYDTQTGTMVGGSRITILGVCNPSNPCKTDPYEQPNSYQIKQATSTTANILIFNTGYKSDAALEVVYGDGTPMSLNLSPQYDRIRLYFDSADGGGVNMNINVFDGTSYNSLGCNFTDPNGPQKSFAVDFPFANFSNGNSGFGTVTAIGFSFDGAQGVYSGEDWGITSIQAVLGGTADITCPNSAK